MEEFDKKLPFSLDAEQSVLGSILIDPNKLGDVAQIIKSDDFYIDEHKEIFSEMQSFSLQSRNIDVVTLIDELVKDGVYADDAAARTYIKLLVSIVPGSSNAKDYAKIVKEKSTLRKLISAGEEIVNNAYAAQDDVSLLVDRAEQSIFEIASDNESRDFIHIKDALIKTYAHLDELKGGATEDVVGIKTGFSDLDRVLVGLGKGNFIIVGARPGMGKTSFCLNIAASIAKRTKKAVCIFSLEMSDEELVSRMLSSEAMIDSRDLRTGMIKPEDWEKLAQAASQLSETDIYIDDTTGIGLTAMKAKLRRVKNLGLVVIDYLQLMESETKRKDGSRVNEIGDISRGIKILAKELGVPVIACSQLSRGAEKEGKKESGRKPMLSDLRDSGAIEQDADMVLFLSRDYYGEDPEKKNLVDVIVAKNRHGGVDTVPMSWLPQYTKFSTLDASLKEGGF